MRGKNKARALGAPKGSMWAKKALAWVKETTSIRASQRVRLIEEEKK